MNEDGLLAKLRAWSDKRTRKKQERLIKEWRPVLSVRWREEIEEEVLKEYEEELETLGDRIFILSRDLSDAISQRDTYKHKYEALVETRDVLIDKVEKTSSKTGELKKEVKTLNTELKEISSDSKKKQ